MKTHSESERDVLFSPEFCSSFEEPSVNTAVREVYRVAAYLRQEMMLIWSKVALPPDLACSKEFPGTKYFVQFSSLDFVWWLKSYTNICRTCQS